VSIPNLKKLKEASPPKNGMNMTNTVIYSPKKEPEKKKEKSRSVSPAAVKVRTFFSHVNDQIRQASQHPEKD
jgi:hypothetical protein